MWLGGPVFLRQEPVSVAGSKCVPVVCMALLEKKSREESENGLDQIIITASDLYTLKKRLAYLVALQNMSLLNSEAQRLKNRTLMLIFWIAPS